jgi:hypothetical protein
MANSTVIEEKSQLGISGYELALLDYYEPILNT